MKKETQTIKAIYRRTSIDDNLFHSLISERIEKSSIHLNGRIIAHRMKQIVIPNLYVVTIREKEGVEDDLGVLRPEHATGLDLERHQDHPLLRLRLSKLQCFKEISERIIKART